MKKISVLIVDDSAVVRQALTQILQQDPGIQISAAVADPIFAMKRMEQQWPDVIVLDVEMPRMDGLTFLKKLMAERPTPVVICSSLTERGAATTMQAMGAGAVSIVTKPKLGVKEFLEASGNDLIQAVKAASHARVKNLKTPHPLKPMAVKNASGGFTSSQAMAQTTEHVVAIGTSTGGTQALEYILTALPRTAPGILVVQHMPEKFTAQFAQRLDGLSEIRVKEAEQQDRVLPGQALIAPGGKHMQLVRSGAQYHVTLQDGPYVNRHKPSVDVLFRSVARCAGRNAAGFIMTGMGNDGAHGLKEMFDAGAKTVAQDEQSCVVFGMPKEAIALGAVAKVLPLDAIAAEIMCYGGRFK